MSAAPTDPLAFDFGLDFESSPQRLKGEADERKLIGENEIKYYVSFLDDCLRSIMPHDLILLGAVTGAGKTEAARNIATANARKGKHVHYFALEAEPREIERRTKYSIVVELMRNDRSPHLRDMNYADWYRGHCAEFCRSFDSRADAIYASRYATLHTYYRGSKFDHSDIKRLFLAIQAQTDLIILDHLHYVDIEDENENRGFKKTVKMIRDVSLGMGKPVIVIAHLRKRDMRNKGIVPDIEMFHGASEIIKIVTRAIMLAPAHSMPHRDSSIANTFMHCPKDRLSGTTGHVAMCQFDRNTKAYLPDYTLGRPSFDGSAFEPCSKDEIPAWARSHTPPSAPLVSYSSSKSFPGEYT